MRSEWSDIKMRYRYEINIEEKQPISVPEDIPERTVFGKLQIHWVQEERGRLSKVYIDVIDNQIRYDKEENISPCDPEVEAKVFNAAYLVANSIFLQTGVQPFDPQNILATSPEMIAETKDEKFELQENPKIAFSKIDGKITIVDKFDPSICLAYFNISSAIAHFSNGCREQISTIKFEQFYKVIESLFEKGNRENADDFDKRVSDHLMPFDPQFTQDSLQVLRRVRNRCVHPNANLGHLSPDDIAAMREVNEYLKNIEKVAKILINNPPL